MFKSTRKILCSDLSEEKNRGKGAESFYSFLTAPNEVKKYGELIIKTPEAEMII